MDHNTRKFLEDAYIRSQRMDDSVIENITDRIITRLTAKNGNEPLTEQYRDDAEEMIAMMAVDPCGWYERELKHEDPALIFNRLHSLSVDMKRKIYREMTRDAGPADFAADPESVDYNEPEQPEQSAEEHAAAVEEVKNAMDREMACYARALAMKANPTYLYNKPEFEYMLNQSGLEWRYCLHKVKAVRLLTDEELDAIAKNLFSGKTADSMIEAAENE